MLQQIVILGLLVLFISTFVIATKVEQKVQGNPNAPLDLAGPAHNGQS